MTHQTGIHVKGRRLLVKPDPIEETVNGFVMVTDKKLERAGQIVGTLVSIGHLCWKDFSDETPWAEVGDAVLYSRYAGKFVEDPLSGENYVILNDEDIIAKITRKESVDGIGK